VPVKISVVWGTVATAIPEQNLIKITAPASEEVFSNIRHKTLVKKFSKCQTLYIIPPGK